MAEPFESKSFPPKFYNLQIRGTRRGIKPGMSHLNRLLFSRTITFEKPFQLNLAILDQSELNRALPDQYSADAQGSPSYYQQTVTASRGHQLSQCTLLKLFLRKKENMHAC